MFDRPPTPSTAQIMADRVVVRQWWAQSLFFVLPTEMAKKKMAGGSHLRARGNTTNLLEKKKKKKKKGRGMTSSEVFKFIYALLRFFLKKKELMWVRT